MSSPKVTYSYANGSANTIRPTGVTYPDNTGGTRVLTYDYGTAGGMNDKLSRVESLGFGGTSNLVQPSYLGLGTQVRTEYTQPQVRWDLATGSSPNPYSGLDRFGRVIDNKWSNYNTSATLDQIKYTYDRASNRTSRENTVAKAQTTPKYFDELYGYDGSNRLTQMQRGQLAGTTSITNLQFAQDWDLDPTGNWQQFSEDSDGNGTNDLVQARTANPVNEITDITNSIGTPWVQPGYDAAGNMTTIPQGNEPEEGFTGVYDAWNRLVKLSDEDDNVVAEYAYDGLTRRIRKTSAAETRHYLYNASWQILEERVGSATTYDRQYVWGPRYIDDCVLRDKSGGARLYALQDANWNVDALVDTSGAVVERFSYTAYGVPSFLNPDFTAKTGSDYAWDVLYAGYKWDAESGMYQVRYRYLLPTIGTWGTRDPIGFNGDIFNLYRYVKSLPITNRDVYGLAQTPIQRWPEDETDDETEPSYCACDTTKAFDAIVDRLWKQKTVRIKDLLYRTFPVSCKGKLMLDFANGLKQKVCGSCERIDEYVVLPDIQLSYILSYRTSFTTFAEFAAVPIEIITNPLTGDQYEPITYPIPNPFGILNNNYMIVLTPHLKEVKKFRPNFISIFRVTTKWNNLKKTEYNEYQNDLLIPGLNNKREWGHNIPIPE